MTRRLTFCIICLAVLVVTCFFATVSAEVIVGVKKGDIVEYQVKCTGEVPPQHDVTNATIEVVRVRGKTIDIKFTSVFLDGTQKTENSILNLETGQLGEAFIIPANLTEGETFVEETEGNITITGIEERAYAGTKRETVTASTVHSIFYWDKQTGFLVEAKSTYTNFTITTQAKQTNIWQPQPYELDPLLAITLVIAVIATVLVIVMIKRKKQSS